jgi:subtilisin family serine protease
MVPVVHGRGAKLNGALRTLEPGGAAMKYRLLLVICLLVLFVQPSNADTRIIVRVETGLTGIQQICAVLGCSVSRGLDGSFGQVFLLSVSDIVDPDTFLKALQRQDGVSTAELDALLRIPADGVLNGFPAWLLDNNRVNYFGRNVWEGYARQPSADIVRLNTARATFNSFGSGVIGVIDTGVDPDHVALRDVLISGYDFTRDTPGFPSDIGDLTQPVSPKVNGVPPAYVNQSTAAVVDQQTAGVLRQYTSFGHGTMVSGVIHMVAPTALIMPLKAFRADGTGYVSDVIRAVYYAVQNGVKVLNMSFSTATYVKEFQRALDTSAKKGVSAVGSAGNDGQAVVVYPAAFDSVMGVASTDYNDQRSSFSNYGQKLVWVAAPGEMIVSTYPFGTYAAASGTSFSTPFVSGAVALLWQLRSNCTPSQAAEAIANARQLGPELGYGRLDIYQALTAVISLR